MRTNTKMYDVYIEYINK